MLAMNPDGTGAPFRERSNMALLMTTAVIYGGVFLGILSDPTNAFLAAGLLVAAVVLQVVALIIAHIAFALGTRQEPDDERDAIIEMRSTRYSDYILGGGVVLSIAAIIAQQAVAQAAGTDAPDTILLHPLLVGHFLLFAFVLSEVVRFATRAISYRRGL